MSFSLSTNDTFSCTYDLASIKREIENAIWNFKLRGLLGTEIWLAELNQSLKADITTERYPEHRIQIENHELDLMLFTLFNAQEYSRVAKNAKKSKTETGTFLYFYSLYKTLEANKPIDFTEQNNITNLDYFNCWKKFDYHLNIFLSSNVTNGCCYYLSGLVCIKLNLKKKALEMFKHAVRFSPLLWQAWLELVKLVSDELQFTDLELPSHWITNFFLVKIYLKFQKYDNAFNLLHELRNNGFKNTNFVITNFAHLYQSKADLEKAMILFQKLQRMDRFRIEDMDTYSNLLYVADKKKEIAHLAHNVFHVNRYTVETCGILGNYYSIRGDHDKAAQQFRRAVTLDPNHSSALILRGHEFMEMKNTRNAVLSYREAILINYQDFRAWYGLGQTYEIKQMPFQALFYYKRAFRLKPNDSRLLIAVGEVYEKLNQTNDAIRCYTRARNIGDSESFAVLHLAKLYSELNIEDKAAESYKQFIDEVDVRIVSKELGDAYRFLAHYYAKQKNYKMALHYALLCLRIAHVREDGKTVLREVAGEEDIIDFNGIDICSDTYNGSQDSQFETSIINV